MVVLAQQRQQVVDMEKAGLPSPSTVANFLLKRELFVGAVVVVDEAGQIDGRQMLELLRRGLRMATPLRSASRQAKLNPPTA